MRDGGLGPNAELGVSILQLLQGLTRLLDIELTQGLNSRRPCTVGTW